MREIIERISCDLPSCTHTEDVTVVKKGENAPLPDGWIAILRKGVDDGKIYHSIPCAEKAIRAARDEALYNS